MELLGWAGGDAQAALKLLSQGGQQLKRLTLSEFKYDKVEESLLSNVEEFRFVQSNLGFLVGRTICEALPLHLKHLDLSYNPLSDTPVLTIGCLLKRQTCQLEDLQLICCQITDWGASGIIEALRVRPSCLRRLALSGNSLSDAAVSSVCDSIVADSTLINLQLGYNPFGKVGLDAIAMTIERGARLETLYLHGIVPSLSGTSFNDPLIYALQRGVYLKELNVSFNHLGNRGSKLVAKFFGRKPLAGNGRCHQLIHWQPRTGRYGRKPQRQM